jgi:hypothetical protein
VAAADEVLEGSIEVRSVARLRDGSERLARVQNREQVCAGEAVQ